MDTRDLHRQAAGDLDRLVAEAARADLAGPTPCAGWTLADLLAHEIGQRIGFAAAVAEGDAPLAAYDPAPFTPELWADASDRLIAAFGAADPDAKAVLVLFSSRPLPIRLLIGAQLLDAAVHAWDVARTLGRGYTPSPDIVAAVGEVAFSIADNEGRTDAGFFAGAVQTEGSQWQRILGHLGRDPHWERPGSAPKRQAKGLDRLDRRE